MASETIQTDVDLSQLIDFTMTFKPLQLTMQNIFQRLDALEKDNKLKSEEIEKLNDLLKEQQEKTRDAPAAQGGADTSHLQDEIDQIKKLLGEMQTVEEQQRLTIDELYAARKQRRGSRPSVSYSQMPQLSAKDEGASQRVPSPQEAHESFPSLQRGSSAQQRTPTPEALYASAEELPLGDKILSLAHEDLGDGYGGPLAQTRRYTEEADGTQGQEEESPSGEVDGRPQDRASRPVSAQDIFPAKPFDPTANSAGSRQPSAGARAPSRTYSVSLMDKVKRDGDDITYLNRVVAEILGEMKTIHGDLDLLRTLNANNQGTEAERKPSVQDGERGTNVAADSGLVEDLANRLASLEERLDTVNHSSEFRDKGLQDEIDDCRRGLRAAARLTDEDVDLLKGLPGLQERLSKVEERAEANENTQESLNEKLTHVLESLNNAGGADGDSGVHPAQFGMLRGTVSALEKQLAELQGKEDKDWTAEIDRLTRAIGELREEASKLGQQVRRTETECERLEDAKENKGARGSIVGSTAVGGNNDDLLQRVLALSSAHDSLTNTVREKTAYLDETKADRTAVQRLGDELHNIKKLMELNSQREAAASGQGDEKVSAANEELIQELQRQLLRQSESTNKGNDMTMDEVERLREMIQQLDYRKADATLVANKAERDYVENALERLMREVEQVLNATNAGLIDTLDKSLNILRDMIDGKATKQDIQRLQLLASRDGASGASPDGLTGFKGYRCLGCNRPMENLRPRSLPSKMDTFLNRTPQNYPQDNVTRSIQQQQQGTALLEQRAASYHSGTKGGRSGTPPLPPIEGPK